MASLQDLLSSTQPDKLQEILNSVKQKDSDQSDKDQQDISDLSKTNPPVINITNPNQDYKKSLDDSDNSEDNDQSSDNKSDESDNEESSDNDKNDLSQHYQEGQEPSDEQKQNLQRLLAGKFDKSELPSSMNTVENLQSAQEAQNKQVGQANLMKALDTLNSGLIGSSMHTTPPQTNPEFYNKMIEQSGEKVKQFKDLAEEEKNDPDSRGSKLSSMLAGQMLQKAGFDPKMVEGMSYNEIEKNFPQLTKMMDAKQNADMRKDLFSLKAKELGQKANESQEQKKTQQQTSAFNNTERLIEQMRGNPAAQQAEAINFNAKKLNSLLQGDLNKLSPNQTALAVLEVSKMATGYAPTDNEIRQLESGALPETLARSMQKITNQPRPANAAQFLQQYKDYANKMNEDAKKYITSRYGRVIETNKAHLSPEDYENLKQNYLNRFTNEESANQKASPQGNSQSNMIKVISPDGKTGSIPQDKLKDALARGFKRAE